MTMTLQVVSVTGRSRALLLSFLRNVKPVKANLALVGVLVILVICQGLTGLQ